MKMTVTLDQDVASVIEERSRITGRTVDELANEMIRSTLGRDEFWSARPACPVARPKKVRIASGRGPGRGEPTAR
jgi:hypothetical protein